MRRRQSALFTQIESARKRLEEWPQWMRDADRFAAAIRPVSEVSQEAAAKEKRRKVVPSR